MPGRFLACDSAGDGVDAGVQDVALLQGGPERPVEPVLEVVLAPPLHDVCEQVAVERRVLVQERRQLQGVLRGDELVETAAQPPAVIPWSGYGLPSPTRLKITR